MSDTSDGRDRNFIYILLASECQQRNNEEHSKTNKTPNKLLGHVTKAAGIEFFGPKNESAVAGTSRSVKDRSRKSGSIKERSFTKLASGGSTLRLGTE